MRRFYSVLSAALGVSLCVAGGCRRDRRPPSPAGAATSLASAPSTTTPVPPATDPSTPVPPILAGAGREDEPFGEWSLKTPKAASSSHRSRYGARFRTAHGRVFLWLDTLVGYRHDRPEKVAADSIQVDLHTSEFLATTCEMGRGGPDERLVAIVREASADAYSPPRLAWLFDVRTLRIRSVPPDSVRCFREGIPEQ